MGDRVGRYSKYIPIIYHSKIHCVLGKPYAIWSGIECRAKSRHGHGVPSRASIVQEGESIGRKSALIFAFGDI